MEKRVHAGPPHNPRTPASLLFLEAPPLCGEVLLTYVLYRNADVSPRFLGSRSKTHSGSTNTITGLRVEGAPSIGGLVDGMDVPTDKGDNCYAPTIPGGWRQGPYLARAADGRSAAAAAADSGSSPAGGNGQLAMQDAVSVIDSSFSIRGGAPCMTTNSSLYLSNAYTTGCATVVSTAGGANILVHSSTPATETTHIQELAASRSDYSMIWSVMSAATMEAHADSTTRTCSRTLIGCALHRHSISAPVETVPWLVFMQRCAQCACGWSLVCRGEFSFTPAVL